MTLKSNFFFAKKTFKVKWSTTTKEEIEARNKIIFENRIVAKKLTLQQLGTMFNITRERVRQIQEREVSTKKLNPQTQDKHADSN